MHKSGRKLLSGSVMRCGGIVKGFADPRGIHRPMHCKWDEHPGALGSAVPQHPPPPILPPLAE
jgi:hypothetical protein